MATTKEKDLLHLDPAYDLAINECLTAKGVSEAFFHRSFFIPITNAMAKPRTLDKHDVLELLSDDIYNIFRIDRKTYKDESLPSSDTNTIVVDIQSSTPRPEDKHIQSW